MGSERDARVAMLGETEKCTSDTTFRETTLYHFEKLVNAYIIQGPGSLAKRDL